MIFDIFLRNKKKQQKELDQRTGFLDENISRTTKVQETNAEVQKGTLEIASKNQSTFRDLKILILENEKTKNILLERENTIKKTINELDEKKQQLRKEEIIIQTRKSDLRKKEQFLEQQIVGIEKERENIKEREFKSDKIKNESEEQKIKYEQLHKEIEIQKGKTNSLEKELRIKNQDADEKTIKANIIFEKAKVIDAEIKSKEKLFEEERVKIESALKDKIEEYDRRLQDLNNVREIVDDIKYDESTEGAEAKIVVKEAIRKAKNLLGELKSEFESLDEKYCTGTFKGFSTPIIEIDKCFLELKDQYQQIKEHFESHETLPGSVSQWLASIEDCILKADSNIKSWEFSESFRFILFGLATCKNYELLLHVLNDWGGGTSESKSDADESDSEFINWYEILNVKENANQEEIKRQWRNFVKIYHPDKATEENKEEYTKKTSEINEAYKILKDETKRKEFDEKRNNYKNKKQ